MQTTNQKHHLEGNAILEGTNAKCCAMWLRVNYYLDHNHMKYLAQTVRLIAYIWENFHHKFANLLVPSTDGTMKRLVYCKVHLHPNRSIIGDAILLQTTSTIKLMKTCGFEFGALLWCPSDATEKNCNMLALLQSLACTIVPKIFGIVYFLYVFWCTQACSFWAIFGLPMRTLTSAAGT